MKVHSSPADNMPVQSNADIRTCSDNANDSGFLESLKWTGNKSLGEACLKHKWVLATLTFLLMIVPVILFVNFSNTDGQPTSRRKLANKTIKSYGENCSKHPTWYCAPSKDGDNKGCMKKVCSGAMRGTYYCAAGTTVSLLACTCCLCDYLWGCVLPFIGNSFCCVITCGWLGKDLDDYFCEVQENGCSGLGGDYWCVSPCHEYVCCKKEITEEETTKTEDNGKGNGDNTMSGAEAKHIASETAKFSVKAVAQATTGALELGAVITANLVLAKDGYTGVINGKEILDNANPVWLVFESLDSNGKRFDSEQRKFVYTYNYYYDGNGNPLSPGQAWERDNLIIVLKKILKIVDQSWDGKQNHIYGRAGNKSGFKEYHRFQVPRHTVPKCALTKKYKDIDDRSYNWLKEKLALINKSRDTSCFPILQLKKEDCVMLLKDPSQLCIKDEEMETNFRNYTGKRASDQPWVAYQDTTGKKVFYYHHQNPRIKIEKRPAEYIGEEDERTDVAINGERDYSPSSRNEFSKPVKMELSMSGEKGAEVPLYLDSK